MGFSGLMWAQAEGQGGARFAVVFHAEHIVGRVRRARGLRFRFPLGPLSRGGSESISEPPQSFGDLGFASSLVLQDAPTFRIERFRSAATLAPKMPPIGRREEQQMQIRPVDLVRTVALAACLALVGPGLCRAGGVPAQEAESTYNRWAWVKDTYWIVPEAGIYSIYHPLGTDQFTVARGQTVFHITDYFNGYFTGSVVVKLTAAQVPNCQYVLGQVTPEGRVYMTMYSVDSGAITNTPLGTMVRKKGQWTMVNQMTGPAGSGTVSHWAYMVQSKPGDRSFRNLPFAEESIPEFLSDCPDGPTIDTR
jgi:hypothetical protein